MSRRARVTVGGLAAVALSLAGVLTRPLIAIDIEAQRRPGGLTRDRSGRTVPC